MGVFVEEKWQPFEDQGPDLLSCLVSMDLLRYPVFLSDKIAESFTAKGLVETCNPRS